MRLDHIGVAVRDLHAAVELYETVGLIHEGIEDVPSEGVRTAFLRVGSAHVELLEPLTRGGVIGKFLDARGEGMHHLAVAVDDILGAMSRARGAGLAVIDERPRQGARGRKVAFVHPKSFRGVLLEFVQNPVP